MTRYELNKCLNNIQHWLIPTACPICGININGNKVVCTPCFTQLKLIKNPCPICGLPNKNNRRCGKCQIDPPDFTRTFAAFNYSGNIPALIHRMKYRNDQLALHTVANLFVEQLQHRANPSYPDLIIPVPIHFRRLVYRGFNQSAELAKVVAKNFRCAQNPYMLIKNRHTLPQQSLRLSERRLNTKGVFSVTKNTKNPLLGKTIAIVDDVMTSGETLRELAKVIKAAGATDVSCWVVARA